MSAAAAGVSNGGYRKAAGNKWLSGYRNGEQRWRQRLA
jgi:hypothetical protein